MAVYLPLIFITSLGAFIKQNKWIYRFAIAFLFIFSAFRSFAFGGADSFYYQVFFRNVPVMNELSIDYLLNGVYGPGFILLTSFAKTIYNDYLFFQIVLSAFSIFLLDKVVKRVPAEEDDYTLRIQFLLCYFCYRFIYNNWISLRQNIANLIIWLVLLSIHKQTSKKGYIKLMLLVLIASQFHSTALINIILIPIIFLLQKIDRKKKVLVVIPMSMLLLLFSDKVFLVVLNVFTQFVDSRYEHYSLGTGSNFVNFAVRIISLLILYMRMDGIKDEKKEVMFDTLLAMSLIGSINVSIVYRFYEYFGIGLYYTLANIPRMFNKSRSSYTIAYLALIFAMIVILTRFCITMDSGLYLNYHFFNN